MADGLFPTLISKNRDANAQDNVIFVQLSDGTTAITTLDVNITNPSIVVTATDLDIRNLNQATDSVAVGDGTDILAVNADGSINVTDNGGSLTVDGTVELGATTLAALESITVQNGAGASAVNIQDGGNSITVDGAVTVSATDLDIRNLDNAQDNVLVYGWDGTSNQKIKTDSDGNLQVDVLTMPPITATVEGAFDDDSAFTVGVDKVGAAGFLADETAPDSVNEGDIGIARMTLDRKQLNVIADPVIDANRLNITGSGEAKVSVTSHTLTAANPLPISGNNAANGENNPIYVQAVTTAASDSEVHNFNSATVTADNTSNHDYTVSNTMKLKKIIVAASGAFKFEVKVGPLASLVTKAVGFSTGRGGDTQQIEFNPPIEIPATGTGTVRVIRTNRENQSQDLYSTIVGNDS